MFGKEDEDLSLIISSTLDHFGYSKEMISFRSKSYDDISNCIANKVGNEQLTAIFVGSAGEGVELSDSDVDLMLCTDKIVCTDQDMNGEHINIVKADYTNSHPGYTKVVSTHLLRATTIGSACNNSSSNISPEGHPYISSGRFRKIVHQNIDKFLPSLTAFNKVTSNGPAVTRQLLNTKEIDCVFSIPYFGNTILSKWANRPRSNNWPSREIIKQVSEMEGYIVPVGDKESENRHLEWRICYTTAEKALIRNLTDAQLKLYVLLKMVASKLIKPVCIEMTSYIVKNIVFWVIEGTPVNQFTCTSLVTLVKKCLYLIKYCLENNHIPNYMIPDRNLLPFSFNGKDKSSVIHFISGLLEEGGFLFQRIPKLGKCIYLECTIPEKVVQYGKWRDEVEKSSSPSKKGVKLIDLTNTPISFHMNSSENGSKTVKLDITGFMIIKENPGQQLMSRSELRECIDAVLPEVNHLNNFQLAEHLRTRSEMLKPL